MTKDYLPVLLQLIVAVGFSAVALLFSVLLGKAGRRNAAKDAPYECGMPVQSASATTPRFSVKFYLVAMLFILFDIEVVFMFPWAVVYNEFIAAHHFIIFWSMLGFVAVLTTGYVYAIMKGVLDWRR
jgi:NADH-quinone oxidoreductase subunit A